jgi:hypothetical protein
MLEHDLLNHGLTLFSCCLAAASMQATGLSPCLWMPLQIEQFLPYPDATEDLRGHVVDMTIAALQRCKPGLLMDGFCSLATELI